MNLLLSALLPFLRLNTSNHTLEIVTEFGVKARVPLSDEEYEEAKKIIKNIF